MKRQEMVIVIAVGFVSAIIAFIVSGIVFGSPKKHPISVPVVNKITSDFPDPQHDNNYTSFFNSQANDPTKVIQIGGTTNPTPFQGTGQ